MRFETQTEVYINSIQTRRRNPVRQATVRIYQSYLNSWILPFFTGRETHLVENGFAKTFITHLNEQDLAPSTVNAIFNVVKAVMASEVDSNGNQKNPRVWNPDFIDLPVVSKADQDAPIATPEQVTSAVSSASGQLQALIVILAATGLRIGECLALRGCSDGYTEGNSWYPETGVIEVRTTLVHGKIEPQPKTDAGYRGIDLHPAINDYLKAANLPTTGFLFQNSLGDRARIETLYDQLEALGLDTGFHAFRRFRATHLESQNVPRSLLAYWLGHSGSTITDRYIKIGQDLKTRKDWAEKAGFGFELPKGQNDKI